MLVNLNEIPGKGGTAPGSGSQWTPDKVKEIIDGVKGLVELWNQSRAGALGDGGNYLLDQGNGAGARAGAGAGNVKGVVVKVLDQLITQGYGDATLLKVIQDTPATIKQLRALLQ